MFKMQRAVDQSSAVGWKEKDRYQLNNRIWVASEGPAIDLKSSRYPTLLGCDLEDGEGIFTQSKHENCSWPENEE